MRNRLNGSNIFDSSERRAFVWIGLVFVLFRGVLCKRINENQTTKSHKPEITKTHEGSVDESSMSVQGPESAECKSLGQRPRSECCRLIQRNIRNCISTPF